MWYLGSRTSPLPGSLVHPLPMLISSTYKFFEGLVLYYFGFMHGCPSLSSIDVIGRLFYATEYFKKKFC